MSKVRTPKTLEQATVLLDEFAQVDGRIAKIEADRNAAIAATNATADALLTPELERAEALRLWSAGFFVTCGMVSR